MKVGKATYKKTSCGHCGKHLNRKNVVDLKRYDDIEGTLWMHRCSCGTFTSIFTFDDDSKNVNFVKKAIPLE